jgi:hypothetical protein
MRAALAGNTVLAATSQTPGHNREVDDTREFAN